MPAEKTKILILEKLKSKNRNWQNSLKNKTYLNIAEELIVSVHTAKAHVCNILHKMQVTDRVQATVKAFKMGIV